MTDSLRDQDHSHRIQPTVRSASTDRFNMSADWLRQEKAVEAERQQRAKEAARDEYDPNERVSRINIIPDFDPWEALEYQGLREQSHK